MVATVPMPDELSGPAEVTEWLMRELVPALQERRCLNLLISGQTPSPLERERLRAFARETGGRIINPDTLEFVLPLVRDKMRALEPLGEGRFRLRI